MITEAIVGHLVGDYLLQNDWMALNKKKASLHCAIHCLIWSASVMVFAGWSDLGIFTLLFTTHFIQDRTTIINRWMQFLGQEKFSQPPMAPWSIIVVDNVWHILTLFIIAKFFL